MSDSEPASLTSALLTRKGHAVPASVSGVGQTSGEIAPIEPRERLWQLWNRTHPSQSSSTALAAPSKPIAKQPQRKRDPRARVGFRLDQSRYLRLRLTAAHRNQTMQDVMMAALDDFLIECKQVLLGGNCACLESEADPKRCVASDATKE